MQRIKTARFLFALVLISLKVFSQQPVQVTPQLLPPYSLQVSDYYGGTQPKMQVMLLNRDINQPVITVKLRMTIQSQNCSMQTKATAVTQSFVLASGVPYYLQPQELQTYFDPANLDFGGGYSQQEYVTTGRFPEGLYTFTLEAYEVVSGNTVSNKGFALAWLTLADPPLLNTPAKAEGVTPFNPQSIVFNWTPRHNTTPTAAYYTDYIFTLAEYNDLYIGPDASFNSSPPLYIDSVQTTTYLYGPDKPQLVPGKRYAWRVQAKARNGSQQLAMFRNNGFSEVYWFTYQNNCPVPLGITATATGQRITIEWQNNPQHIDYKVEYREKNNPDAQWFSLTNRIPRLVLTDLKPGTQYEYRVGGSCLENAYTYSALMTFTTNGSAANAIPSCGDSTLPVPGGGNTLTTLVDGNVIHAGSFDVVVGYTQGTSSFTGRGYVVVPWLMNAKVEVRFTGITLSQDYKLLSGVIETTYDPNESGIDDIDEYVDVFTGGQGVGGVLTGLLQSDTTLTITIGSLTGTPPGISLPPGFNPANPSYPVTITIYPQGGGSPQTIQVNKLPYTIQDKDGTIYQVGANGAVTKVASPGGGNLLEKIIKTSIDNDRGLVTFQEDPNGKYAFDAWRKEYKKSNSFNKEYERLKLVSAGGLQQPDADGSYYVTAKAIAPGETEPVIVKLQKPAGSNLNTDSVQFVTGKGSIYPAQKLTDSTYRINVLGGPASDAQEIYAVYPQTGGKNFNLGKLLVASYGRKEFMVVLVPVNGATVNIDSAMSALKQVYEPLNISFIVKVDPAFNNTSWDVDNNGLTVTGSSAFSVLTDEMKSLNNAFRKSRLIDKKATYLFVINNSNQVGARGDMPRGKQFGYVFVSANHAVRRTIAHEIGHGLFRLSHLNEYGSFSETSVTENLMQTGTGLNLNKYQWDLLHDPALLLLNFDSDEDAMDRQKFEKVQDFLNAIKNRNSGLLDYDVTGLMEDERLTAVRLIDLNDDGIDERVVLKFPTLSSTQGVIHFNVSATGNFLNLKFYINTNNLLHNEFVIDFFQANSAELAFQLITYKYVDCDALLKFLRMNIDGLKPSIITQYKNAVATASSDCDKLDVIFESIPDFVINSTEAEFSDASLWNYLVSIASCSMNGSVGTDEEEAALNILRGFRDRQYLYNQIIANPTVLINLYNGIDGGNCYRLLNAMADLSDAYSAPPSSNHFIYIGKTSRDTYPFPDVRGNADYLNDISMFGNTAVEIRNYIGRAGFSVQLLEELKLFNVPNILSRIIVYKEKNTVQDVLPAIYVQHLASKQKQGELTKAISDGAMYLGFMSSVRILFAKGAGYLAKAIAFGNLVKDGFGAYMSNDANRQRVAAMGAEGKWIADHWDQISIAADLTTISADILVNFARNGAKVSQKLAVRGDEEASKSLDEMVKASSAVLDDYGDDVAAFMGKTAEGQQKHIAAIWKIKYPVQEMLEGRVFFEDVMGELRYKKVGGWFHTSDIADNFKAVDFYKGITQGNQIFAETAVSMKTTITTNVDNWLASAPVQKNIQFLEDGLNPAKGILSNGKILVMQKAEIHIYMPRENITEALTTDWMNKLNLAKPNIKFEINALEDFVK